MRYAKRLPIMAGLLGVLIASAASGSPAINLTGTYRCIQGCVAGFEDRPAFVTQNGWDINIVTEAGIAARANFDWGASNNRIWIEAIHQGAVFAVDGTTIQFDRGGVWRRVVEPDPALIAYCARRYRSYQTDSHTYLGHDGFRHPCLG